MIDAITSTSGPYRLAKRSGSVSRFSALILRAKKIPLKISESPRPVGRTAPSQKWYLYERSALPRSALLSMDCDASVSATTNSGRERPATKKFSALPLMKMVAQRPTPQKTMMARITATPNPSLTGAIFSGQGSAQTSIWQQLSFMGMVPEGDAVPEPSPPYAMSAKKALMVLSSMQES